MSSLRTMISSLAVLISSNIEIRIVKKRFKVHPTFTKLPVPKNFPFGLLVGTGPCVGGAWVGGLVGVVPMYKD